MKKTLLSGLFLVPLFASAFSTGFQSPSATPAPNGGWVNPENAFASDDVYTEVPHGSGCRCPFLYLSWNNGVNYTSANIVGPFGTTDNTMTTGSSSDLWGHAWTESELTNANFRLKIANPSTLIEQGYGDFNFNIPPGSVITGIEVRVEQHGDAGFTMEYVDHIQVNVHYTNTCPDPTGLVASNITAGAADLDWDAVSGINGFEYVLNTTAAAPAGSGTATTDNFFNATSLSPGTTYYFHLRVDCGGGAMSAWVTIPFTTSCADPTGLASSNITTGSADFDWDAVSGITGFEYELNTTATAPTGAGTATTANSFDATSLTAGTTYYFHLRVNCGSGNFSDWVTITFNTLSVCTDPTGLVASAVTNTTANLNWTAVGGITGFEYVLNTTAADPTGAGSPLSTNTYNATALTAGTTYYFHLRKNCGVNFSGWVDVSFTTTTVSVNEITSEQMAEVYPNPSTGLVNLKTLGVYREGQLTITDMTGKSMASLQITNENTLVDITAYAKQVYYFIYTSDDRRQVFKVVKQ